MIKRAINYVRRNQIVRLILECICIFFLYLLFQLKFINHYWFPSDEQDIMLGGKAIARGFALYKDYLSQHMPVSYYISAFFELLGAHSIAFQRLYFYVFYSLMWIIIYLRYQKVVRKQILVLYPVCFLAVIGIYQHGTVILSEHLAGLGFVILLLEYFRFIKEKDWKWSNCVMLSISVLLTFGTIFIAAFGIFVIGAGVLTQECIWAWERKEKPGNFFLNLWKHYWKPGLCVFIPWAVYLIYLKVNEMLQLFYFSAYEMNRTIYSKYLEGYGESIFASVLSMPVQFVSMIQGWFTSEEGITVAVIVQVMITVSAIAFIIYLGEKKNKVVAVVCFLFIIALGTRGYFFYHGTHCVEILCFMACGTFVELIIKSREHLKSRSIVYKVGIVCGILLIFVPYMADIDRLASLSFNSTKDYYGNILAKITEKDEPVWNCTLSNEVFVEADRVGLYNVGGVPWFWDAHGRYVIDKFSDAPPKAVLIDRDLVIWGYSLNEYGKELLEYIDKYYSRYEESILYIRNDYLDEAKVKISG